MSDEQFYKSRVTELERENSFLRQQINNDLARGNKELRDKAWQMFCVLVQDGGPVEEALRDSVVNVVGFEKFVDEMITFCKEDGKDGS